MLDSAATAPAADGAHSFGETATTAPSPETTETPAAETPEDPGLSRQFAALTRRERQIQERARQTSAREKALEEKEAKYAQWEAARERAKVDPLGYLQESGLTYKQITEKILEDDNLTPEQKAERIAQAKIDEYAKSQEEKAAAERERREKEEQQAKEEALIAEYKSAIQTAVADSEEFELINFEGASGHDLVFEVAAEHYDKTGEIIDPKVAATHVEKYLEKRYKEVFNTKKLSKLRDLAPEETQRGESEHKTDAPRTLTNRSTLSSASPSDTSSYRMMSDEESKAAAAETLRKALASQG